MNIKIILDKANVWFPPVDNFIIDFPSNDEINFGLFWETFEKTTSSWLLPNPKENTSLVSIIN